MIEGREERDTSYFLVNHIRNDATKRVAVINVHFPSMAAPNEVFFFLATKQRV